ADHAPHVDTLVGRRELRPAPSAPLEEREAIAVVLVQRLAFEHERGHDRHVALGEIEGEAMLLENRVVRPAPRPVELSDDEAVADADLIDAVLVARERDDAAVALEADALDRLENDIGTQAGVRQLRVHPGPPRLIARCAAAR